MRQQSARWVDFILLFFVYLLLILLSLFTILPFMRVITISMSPSEVTNSYGIHLIPLKFDFTGYRIVFKNRLIGSSYVNSIFRTALGTVISVVLTFLGAYPLSKKSLPHRSLWTGLILLTMFFNGGLIPNYLLVKSLGIMNSIWALVLPGSINTFMLLVTRNFISTLPNHLEEQAKIDGAHELTILFRIIVPLSMPILATIALYSGIGHWNAWFDALLYISDEKKQVLQIILRRIILEGQQVDMNEISSSATSLESTKMAALLVAIIPIMMVYPFLQKHFVKGILVGSIKG
jgi:putative aldouronate transport system permease protein